MMNYYIFLAPDLAKQIAGKAWPWVVSAESMLRFVQKMWTGLFLLRLDFWIIAANEQEMRTMSAQITWLCKVRALGYNHSPLNIVLGTNLEFLSMVVGGFSFPSPHNYPMSQIQTPASWFVWTLFGVMWQVIGYSTGYWEGTVLGTGYWEGIVLGTGGCRFVGQMLTFQL